MSDWLDIYRLGRLRADEPHQPGMVISDISEIVNSLKLIYFVASYTGVTRVDAIKQKLIQNGSPGMQKSMSGVALSRRRIWSHASYRPKPHGNRDQVIFETFVTSVK